MNAAGFQTANCLWCEVRVQPKGCRIYRASAVDILWFWAEGLCFNSDPGAIFGVNSSISCHSSISKCLCEHSVLNSPEAMEILKLDLTSEAAGSGEACHLAGAECPATDTWAVCGLIFLTETLGPARLFEANTLLSAPFSLNGSLLESLLLSYPKSFSSLRNLVLAGHSLQGKHERYPMPSGLAPSFSMAY